jgi:hypothetical protein
MQLICYLKFEEDLVLKAKLLNKASPCSTHYTLFSPMYLCKFILGPPHNTVITPVITHVHMILSLLGKLAPDFLLS